MPAENAFAGWLVFDRCGGGYLAVCKANVRRYVQASTLIELAAAVVLANSARAWTEIGSGR